jgi:hypothetical protein
MVAVVTEVGVDGSGARSVRVAVFVGVGEYVRLEILELTMVFGDPATPLMLNTEKPVVGPDGTETTTDVILGTLRTLQLPFIKEVSKIAPVELFTADTVASNPEIDSKELMSLLLR